MATEPIEMQEVGPALEPGAIERLEAAINAPLPAEYREFLAATNGGRTPRSRRTFRAGRAGQVALNYLHSLDEDGSPLQSDGWRPDWIPTELLPIGSASGGIVALCLRGEHAGSVWYLDTADARPEGSNPRVLWHDRRDFARVGDSFNAFLASLGPL